MPESCPPNALEVAVKSRSAGIAACILAVFVFAVGLVVKNQADFSQNYLKSQLTEHGIIFTPVPNLLPQQKKVRCLVKNSGKLMSTGKQAECYAKYQIGIDLTLVDNGKTYAQDHYNGYLSRVKAAAAVAKAPDAPETAVLVAAAAKQDRISDDLLAGEATKGLLLTGYGFGVIGERLAEGAIALFVLAGLLLVAGVVLIGRRPSTAAA